MKTWAVNDWNFQKNVELIYAFDTVSTDVINSGYWIHFMIEFKNIGDKIKYKDHPRSHLLKADVFNWKNTIV